MLVLIFAGALCARGLMRPTALDMSSTPMPSTQAQLPVRPPLKLQLQPQLSNEAACLDPLPGLLQTRLVQLLPRLHLDRLALWPTRPRRAGSPNAELLSKRPVLRWLARRWPRRNGRPPVARAKLANQEARAAARRALPDG